MNTTPATTPVQVNGSTAPPTLAAAARYLLTILGTFAVARGWVNVENVDGIITALVTLGTVAYGLWKTRQKQAQLITVAESAPDRVAQVN